MQEETVWYGSGQATGEGGGHSLAQVVFLSFFPGAGAFLSAMRVRVTGTRTWTDARGVGVVS